MACRGQLGADREPGWPGKRVRECVEAGNWESACPAWISRGDGSRHLTIVQFLVRFGHLTSVQKPWQWHARRNSNPNLLIRRWDWRLVRDLASRVGGGAFLRSAVASRSHSSTYTILEIPEHVVFLCDPDAIQGGL